MACNKWDAPDYTSLDVHNGTCHNGRPNGIPVEVWKSLGEEGVDMLLDPGDFRAGENARGMEGQCDCANLQREGGHPGLWELQRHQDEISYHEDL